MSRVGGTQSRHKPRRVLVVKMLAAKAGWLEGPVRWRDGSVAWGEDCARPGPRELAAAQRALNQIARYPAAAGRAVGDLPAFLARRRARLALAKRLGDLAEPDLAALGRLAKTGDADAVRRLGLALVVEALSVETLAARPSAALVACGARAELRRVAGDDELPDEARALAALALGASCRNGRGAAFATTRDLSAPCRDAFALGRSDGLPADPWIAVRLLAAHDGAALARRCAGALASESRFRASADDVRAWLAEGEPPATVVAVAEALAEAGPVGDRILAYRDALPPPSRQDSRLAVALRLAAEREVALDAVAARVLAYARADRDPDVVRAAVALVDRTFGVAPLEVSALGLAATDALDEGLALAPRLRLAFLGLLLERHGAIWDPTTVPSDGREARATERLRPWLVERHAQSVRPARLLLERSGDASVVAGALDADALAVLRARDWPEPDTYRVALELLRLVVPAPTYVKRRICTAVSALAKTADARAAFRAVARALATAPADACERVLEDLFEDWRYERASRRAVLRRLHLYVPHLVEYRPGTAVGYGVGYLVRAVASLEAAAPERAMRRFEIVRDFALAAAKRDPKGAHDYLIPCATRLGILLAGDDDERFERVFRALVRTAVAEGFESIASGVDVLAPRPAACEALAGVFLERPRRATALVERLGVATRLGPGALAPLAALDARDGVRDDAPSSSDGAWERVLALRPELGDAAAAYRRARRAAGEPDDVPPGVRRALDLPEKLARESRHLDALLAREPFGEPARADLAARAASLRARLSDDEALRRAAGEDAAERLERATVEARAAALERAALECFRAKLVSLVGAVPDGLVLDDALRNAILMGANLTENRKLLAELVRAHVRGETGWRERLPANVAFLNGLAERGVDPEVWSAEHARVYACPAAPGGRVRVAFESRPVEILRMGSYFDSCLGADDINAFSAVTNACELNKRVSYATDARGRVVGRKLVALNERGALVGYNAYARSHDEAVNSAVRLALRSHAIAFAETCGLELASDGKSPLLFADDWYDDGPVAWEDPKPAEPKARSKSFPLTKQRQRVTLSK